MNLFFALPLISLVGGLLTLMYHFRNQSTNLLTNVFILLSFVLSVGLVRFIGHPQLFELPFLSIMNYTLKIKLQIDNLSIIMLLLINFVSFVIHRYATSYLSSDLTQGRFMAQLSILSGAVSFLSISGNLLTAFIAWQFVGLSLYLLLNHYHYDPGANKAAKKNFIINIIGDFCFLTAVVLCYKFYGNSDFTAVSSGYQALKTSVIGFSLSVNSLIVLLLLVAVMTKSAQFPFHIWLPDTMQAPTPVSAIMHAGVINAGGFLLTRISPIISGNLFLTDVIFTIGVITLLSASFFALSQSDIKKQLAYSTMGQMGFMIMQCGLGLYAAAVFHLIAHGFYKGFLFLSAGDNLLYKKKSPQLSLKNAVLSILVTIMLLVSYYFTMKTIGFSLNTHFIVVIFISITVVHLFKQILEANFSYAVKFGAGLLVILLFAIYWLLVSSIEHILLMNYASVNVFDDYKTIIGVLLLLCQIFVWIIPVYAKNLPAKLVLQIYHLSRNKLFIEYAYRKYLLKPYRGLGDLFSQLFVTKFYHAIFVALGGLILANTYLGLNRTESVIDYSYYVLFNQLIYLVMLIAANRVTTISRLNWCLLISQISLVNIGLFMSLPIGKNIALFQLANSILIFIAINILLKGKSREVVEMIDKNLLSLNGAYFSVLLFLIIGLPGSANFITEFNILISLTSGDLGYIFFAGLGYLMLAIAIMHALQDHVFNSNSIFLPKNIYLTSREQFFILGVIFINLLSGIYPDFILNNI